MPSVHQYRAVLVASTAQLLPPLLTTALHGALGHALGRAVCLHAQRPACDGCEVLMDCPYTVLASPLAADGADRGVTDHAPTPLVLSPEVPVRSPSPLALEAGQQVAVRLCLIGPRAAGQVRLLRRALEDVAGRGLGISPDRAACRPSLQLQSFDENPRPPEPQLPVTEAVRLRLVTPLRLARDGRITGRLDAPTLTRALLRRADLLSRLYGHGPITRVPGGSTHWNRLDGPFDSDEVCRQLDELAAGTGLRLRAEELRVLSIGRYSSRQDRRMCWPGLIGEARLTGPALPMLWPLLRFCAQVHLGKAASFGFGRFTIHPGD